MTIFVGNCPSNVSKDAKYTIRLEEDSFVVGLYYESADGELWYTSNVYHPELVEMVNEVKIRHTGSPGGAFYINEYQQVIVPTVGNDKNYYYAGEYINPLEFEFEGKILSGDAKDLEGNPLNPGGQWKGPRLGIPYVLKAGGNDIYYRYSVRPNVEKKVSLSEHIGGEAEIVSMQIAQIRGLGGGRFYINEYQQVFTPTMNQQELDYIYVCKIDDLDKWFPKPIISGQ